jgi:hypothetical protein
MDSISDNYEFDHSYPHPDEVEAEYSKATLMPEAQAWLTSQGVPIDAMEGVVECASGFVRDEHFDIHFKIDPKRGDGVRTAFHIPVYIDGRFVDLVRFTRHNPLPNYSYGGRVCHAVTWLGSPLPDSTPTPIWRSPLNWLRSGRQGLCYLRMSRPSWRFELLRDLPAVMGEDIDHARQLNSDTWEDCPRGKPRDWARFPKAADVMPHVAAEVTAYLKGAVA